jgi:hypothetical protein
MKHRLLLPIERKASTVIAAIKQSFDTKSNGGCGVQHGPDPAWAQIIEGKNRSRDFA